MTPADMKSIRQQLGLTQAEFCALVGVKNRNTVRRWESGEIAIPEHTEIILANVKPKPARKI